MEIAVLKLLTVGVVIGYIVWEIVKLYRDPELRSSGDSSEGDGQG